MTYSKTLFGVACAGGLAFAAGGALAMGERPDKTSQTTHVEETYSATQSMDGSQRCKVFGDEHKKSLSSDSTVSGTIVRTSYDSTSGFCTVEVEQNGPNGRFSSSFSTNDMTVSPTRIMMQRIDMPIKIVKYEPPQRLLCSKVTKQKDGKLLCEPAKLERDPFFSPFLINDFWF